MHCPIATALVCHLLRSGADGRRRRPGDVCEGKRFEASVLEYTFGGHDICEVLAMLAEAGHGQCSR
jgi:hypothetical protein